jgi:hypothetical protein
LGALDFAQEIGILDALPGKEIDFPAEFCSQLISEGRFVGTDDGKNFDAEGAKFKRNVRDGRQRRNAEAPPSLEGKESVICSWQL